MPRGGRRKNQTGRPKKDPDAPVIPLTHYWREKIKTGQIIARMNQASLGELDVDSKDLAVQVSAARLLLDKSMPNLQTTQLEGNKDHPIQIITRAE